MDYHRLTQQLEALLPMTYVDLFPCLTGDSYYRTDPHWRQDALQPVVEALTSAMDVPLSWDLTAQDAGRFPGRTLGNPVCLWSRTASATSPAAPGKLHGAGSEGEIPCTTGKRPRGETPMIFSSPAPPPFRFWRIRRPYRTGSWWCSGTPFGSSLAPLLAGSYRKITLIDLQYISSDLLESYVCFQEQDVLFLYSALIWNQSGTIR